MKTTIGNKDKETMAYRKMTIAEMNQSICDIYGRYYREIEKLIGTLSCDPFYDFKRLLDLYKTKLKSNPQDNEEQGQLKADLRRWYRRYKAWLSVREEIDAGTTASEEYGDD